MADLAKLAAENLGRPRRQVGVQQKHSDLQQAVLAFSGERQHGTDIVPLKIGKLRQQVIFGHATGEVTEHIANRYPQVPDTRLSATAGGINRNSMRRFHHVPPYAILASPGPVVESPAKPVGAVQHSIRVNQQWRVCFRWEQGHAHDVELVACH